MAPKALTSQLPRLMAPEVKLLAVCLAGVFVSLLIVGLVSDTFVRHLVQITPIVVVLLMIVRRSSTAPYAALPIFIVWAAIMVLIGLYLLGMATFFSGSFSRAEVVLTAFIAAFSLVGIAACFRAPRPPIADRILAFGMFTVIQVAAMWISFLPAVANR